MNLINLLLKNKCVEEFSDKKIDAQQVQLILESGLLSSQTDYFPLDLIVVEDKNIIKKLKYCTNKESLVIESCAILIAVCAYPLSTPNWYEMACQTTITMQLMATELDIDTSYIYLKDEQTVNGRSSAEYVASNLDLPMQIQAVSLLCLGYQKKNDLTYYIEENIKDKTQNLSWDKVHIDKYTIR